MVNKAYKINPSQSKGLINHLIRNYGLPDCYEELTIYQNASCNTVKLTMSNRDGISLHYRNEKRKIISTLSLESQELKNILWLLAGQYGNKGYISTSPVFSFEDKNCKVKVVEKSLAGKILYIEEQNIKNCFKLDEYVEYIGNEVVDRSPNTLIEQILNFSVSSRGVLNSNILSFLERNGVFLKPQGEITHRKLLQNRSNNYQHLQHLFHELTQKELLSVTPFPLQKISLDRTKASIIIPCYNTSKTILQALDSIEKQNTDFPLKNLEVILVDDCSKYSVKKTLAGKKYPFSLQIIRVESNIGASSARALGAVHASGDILIFQDSDILLMSNYLQEHLIRNITIPNAVFVSFKENIEDKGAHKNLENLNTLPDYSKDLRIFKDIPKDAIGSYSVDRQEQIEILESTNYFKSFQGSRVFGVYDLSCMVVGHNFSLRKSTLQEANPFSRDFHGWGMEDVYFGLKIICQGNFVIPILSTGVYHIDHPLRSGSAAQKESEYRKNTKRMNSFLNSSFK